MSRPVLLALVLLAALSAPAHAQAPDFLFGKPNGTVAVHTGRFFARGGSDVFSYVQSQLTLDNNDFHAPLFGVDVDMPVKGRLSAIAGFEFSRSSADSEYRDFVDNDRLPITQSTQMQEVNLSYGIKLALTPPGREISAHAWIPAAVTPYVGAMGGALWYKFNQSGDFVNFDDLSVFRDTVDSRGWTPSASFFGGVDVKAWKRVYVNAEARYLWSRATLDRSFSGFDAIDLTGMKVTAGLRYMF
jgi:hypothetical protein